MSKEYLKLKLPFVDVEAKIEVSRRKWQNFSYLHKEGKDFFYYDNSEQIAKERAEILNVKFEYNVEYWQEVNKLNKEDFKKLGIWVTFEYINSNSSTRVFITIEATEENPNVEYKCFQSCGFNEVGKIEKYYELAQRLLEIEGGVI